MARQPSTHHGGLYGNVAAEIQREIEREGTRAPKVLLRRRSQMTSHQTVAVPLRLLPDWAKPSDVSKHSHLMAEVSVNDELALRAETGQETLAWLGLDDDDDYW